jgi:hypothetical protein
LNSSTELNESATDIPVPADSPMADSIEEPTTNADRLPANSETAGKLAPYTTASGSKPKKRSRQAVKNIVPANGVSLKTELAKEVSARKVSKTCESDKENVPEDVDLGEVMMED